jgi:diaminopimelate epimerase
MRLFNADGGEAELSGNGLRCLALFIKELGLSGKKDLTIETIGGKTKLELLENNRVRVWMPKPIFERKLIPMIGEGECVEEELDFSGGKFNVTALSLGNPHCVLFGDFNLSQVLKWGTIIESSKYFPRHTNVEFAYLLHEDRIRLMVFERGVGLTDACGSGACAVTIAGIKTGRLRFDTPITIMQKGGDLLVKVTLDFKDVILEGEARKVFEGKVDV